MDMEDVAVLWIGGVRLTGLIGPSVYKTVHMAVPVIAAGVRMNGGGWQPRKDQRGTQDQRHPAPKGALEAGDYAMRACRERHCGRVAQIPDLFNSRLHLGAEDRDFGARRILISASRTQLIADRDGLADIEMTKVVDH